jgi:DNA-3-methyladenine glycosylase I
MSAAYCRLAPGHPFHGRYHESEYGFPAREDAILFERLVLEINQAGLSWLTVLKKRDAFRAAFASYDIDKVASFSARDRQRLMNDEGIIRNRLKIEAVIENAKRLQAIRESHGSFAAWLDAHHPLTKEKWVKLFKQNFRFTGGEIVGEFLMSLGYLKGAHVPSCPIHATVAKLAPPWAKGAKKPGARASA